MNYVGLISRLAYYAAAMCALIYMNVSLASEVVSVPLKVALYISCVLAVLVMLALFDKPYLQAAEEQAEEDAAENDEAK